METQPTLEALQQLSAADIARTLPKVYAEIWQKAVLETETVSETQERDTQLRLAQRTDSVVALNARRDVCAQKIARYEATVARLKEDHAAVSLLIKQCEAHPSILDVFDVAEWLTGRSL